MHQVKKKIKWECKLCGEKQSFKRSYGIGTAKECRIHVQKLNLINGEAKEAIESKGVDDTEDEEEDLSPPKPKRPFKSKWKSYVDDAEEQVEKEAESNEQNAGGVEVVLEMPRKTKKIKWQPPTAHYNKDNTITESTENFTDENYSYNNIETDIIHWHAQVVEAKQEVKPVPHTHAQAITSTSEVSKVNVKTVPSVNRNSKWAQYVEEEEGSQPMSPHDTTDILPEKTDVSLKSQNLNMFSLNDDINLDDFLDF